MRLLTDLRDELQAKKNVDGLLWWTEMLDRLANCEPLSADDRNAVPALSLYVTDGNMIKFLRRAPCRHSNPTPEEMLEALARGHR